MTTSEGEPDRLFVWVWLPGASDPVVAGRLDAVGDVISFTYGRSYRDRIDAVPLYLPELPLRPGPIEPEPPSRVAGCIRDAGPDAWGQRVILAARNGRRGLGKDVDDPGLLTFLRDSGSNRVGALDFQESSETYVPRTEQASLADLQRAAAAVEAGEELPPALSIALEHGTSVGGARPKALITADDGRQLIAKFSSSDDRRPVVKAEAAAMHLARLAGIDVASTQVTRSLGRDVLLVERFDRPLNGGRLMVVSALTVLGLAWHEARYASYVDLAWQIRNRFVDPLNTLRELFARIVFNVCVSNFDDHPRNHAAFWDGRMLRLTPAYDICPQPRSGETAAQAMAIDENGTRTSRLRVCLDAAGSYLLERAEAADIIGAQVDTIRQHWSDAADVASLTQAERTSLWGRQILNPAIFYDYPAT